jgi:hypothetical protein
MYGLIKLHSRLEGDLQKQKENLAHVRAVIKIVDSDFDLASIKPKRTYRENRWFKRGEAFLVALDVLREASGPLRPMEIAIRMLARKNIQQPTAIDRRNAWNAIKKSMDFYDGRTVQAVGRIRARRWQLKK